MAASDLSTAELMQIAGVGGGNSSLSSMSNDDLMKIAGVQPPSAQPESFLGKVWEDVKGTPRAALNMVESIPSGAENLYESIFHPSEAVQSGAMERAARGIGAGAAFTAGAGAGALTGPLAPIASPLLGSAAVTGYNWLNQLLGSDQPTTPEQDVENLRKMAVQGGVLGAAGEGAAAGLGKLGSAIEDVAAATGRKSLGARASDYGKVSDTRTIETPEGEIETPVKAALNKVLSENVVGLSRNPSTMLARIGEKQAMIGDEIGSLIRNFDADPNSPAALVDFTNARKYLDSGKVPADLVDAYRARLDDLENDIHTQGGGSLEYLQNQKTALGKSYDPADKVLSGFNRAIYRDIKGSIEKYIPEVKGLNQELQPYQILEPIVTRSLKAHEAGSPLSTLGMLYHTTGGAGAPAILGGILGGGHGAILGGLLGGGAKLLASPQGQALVSRGLGMMPTELIPELFSKAAGAVGPGYAASSNPFSDVFTNPNPQTAMSENTGLPVKDVEAKIDADPYYSALYQTESSRNPLAHNPHSSAKGGFQFVDATAKALGLENPLDLGSSFDAVKDLTDQNRAAVGNNPAMLYSAHYLGVPLLKKWMSGAALSDKEEGLVRGLKPALERFNRAYARVSAGIKTV